MSEYEPGASQSTRPKFRGRSTPFAVALAGLILMVSGPFVGLASGGLSVVVQEFVSLSDSTTFQGEITIQMDPSKEYRLLQANSYVGDPEACSVEQSRNSLDIRRSYGSNIRHHGEFYRSFGEFSSEKEGPARIQCEPADGSFSVAPTLSSATALKTILMTTLWVAIGYLLIGLIVGGIGWSKYRREVAINRQAADVTKKV